MCASQAVRFSGDIYVFNMETHEWDVLPSKGCRVPERDFHTATAVLGTRNRKLVVFGGRSKSMAWSGWRKKTSFFFFFFFFPCIYVQS